MYKLIFLGLACIANICTYAADRPNILWIYGEDTSPWMGCYGDLINAEATPNIDSIAKAGVKFERAFVPAPVCSATRSAMIVGQSGIRFGAHQHRSSRMGHKIHLPEGILILPEILQAHGYTTFNHGKTDYNFVWKASSYNYQLSDPTDFSDLVTKQPFFGQIQTKGGKNNTQKFPEERKVDPNLVDVPKDYPDNDVYRAVVAQHYDAIRMDDDLIGTILSGLEVSGLSDNTIVVYFSDHGANNLVRHKQMTTEGGLHVPFLMVGPRPYVPSEQVRVDLVDMLDLSATTLAWASIEKPEWYEGQDLFGEDFVPRSFVAAHKDRLDHTVDRVRSIRTDHFRYVRNYKLDRIFLQPQYRDRKEFTQNLHDLYRKGELSALHREIYFGERPAEELYKVSIDPNMLVNLAADQAYVDILNQHRILLSDWLSAGDCGIRKESIQALRFNGEGTKWGEGVNVEYEVYRADSDGDGLSDKWESLNGRDPLDGNLYYEFDCGGWQTEGWISPNISSNLAGFLGYLDFYLDDKVATLRREGLKVIQKKENQTFILRLRTSKDLNVKVLINEQLIGLESIQSSNEYEQVSMNFRPKLGQEIVELLEVVFEGEEGAFVEIDTILLETI